MKPSIRGRKKKARKWRKPEGMPKRPLSAYNLFFAQERQNLLDSMKTNTFTSGAEKSKKKIGFANLARSVASKWKTLSDAEKEPFTNRAAKEQERYKMEVKHWQSLGLDPRIKKKPRTCATDDAAMYGMWNNFTLETGPWPSPRSSTSMRNSQPFPGFQTVSSVTQTTLELTGAGYQESPVGLAPSPNKLNRADDSSNRSRLEPKDKKYFNESIQVDYKELSARLFQELNHQLDDEEVGYLKSAFARSA